MYCLLIEPGKNINYLIPELFHQNHDKVLLEFNEKAELTFYKELYMKDNYIPQYLEATVYAISKSKFLIPIELKIYFVQTEGNEFVYVVEIKKIKDYQKILENIEDNDLKCVVLTDDNFCIQTFTPNCVNYLKLNYSYINSSYNIMNYIKDLKTLYIKKVNELVKVYSSNNSVRNFSYCDNSEHNKIFLDDISYRDKKKIKRELIEEYFLEENEITWKLNFNNQNNKINILFEESIFEHSLVNNNDNNYYLTNKKNFYEEQFIMKIRKIILSKELIGYYFIFKNIPKELYNSNKFITFNINNKNDRRRNSITRQKKYKYLFQIKPNTMKKKSTHFIDNESFPIKRSKSPNKLTKLKGYEKEEFVQLKKISSNPEINKSKEKKHISSKNIKSKYKTDITNEENKNQIAINDEYIPECPFNFAFDFLNRTYKPIFDIKNENGKNLNDILKFHALIKINSTTKVLNVKKGKKSEIFSYTSDSEESEIEERESSSAPSNSKSNSENSLNINGESSNIHKISSTKQKKNETENNNVNPIKEKNINNPNNKQIQNKNDILNNFYRVNLDNIHFSIYDFNKDMVIDNDFEKISKIENIMKNSKSRMSLDLNNNEEYPNFLYGDIFENKKKEYKKKIKKMRVIKMKKYQMKN